MKDTIDGFVYSTVFLLEITKKFMYEYVQYEYEYIHYTVLHIFEHLIVKSHLHCLQNYGILSICKDIRSFQ